MSFPHKLIGTKEQGFITVSGNNSDGDVVVALNVPAGRKLEALMLKVAGTSGSTVFGLTGYTDSAQTLLTPAVAMAEPNDTTQVTSITLTAGTKGTYASILPYTGLFAGVGIRSFYGFALNVNITGAAGTWEAIAIYTEE